MSGGDLEIRTITDGEVEAFRDVLMATFGDDSDSDPGGPARQRALLDVSQTWAAFDGPVMVATAATFPLTMILPGGGTLRAAGLTQVTVRPTHRRRGVLRRLMQLHLDDARRRRYPASALWASEASIYGRFGYGIATEADVLEIERANVLELGSDRELDTVEWVEEARAREVLPGIYERAIANRPGALVRPELWWRERRFLDAPFMRRGASRRRHVVARRGDELVGYVAFRQRGGFTNDLPSGTTDLIELHAVDGRAEATLWRFVLQIDLFPTVTWVNAPTDAVLDLMVSDPRHIKRRRIDTLWLRIEDVASALAARGYLTDGTLRLAIEGTTWELVVEGGHGRCVPSRQDPELRMSLATLAMLYLGTTSATRLARADRVHGGRDAIATADRLFASPIAPWCPEMF
jgi:predicted acetyltransferase